ncbi:MAG: DNA polymerase III subunit chi [Pseudomonadales bacterium]|nr:DNA polymerase III subunit chi [Pseudomonadales bacterium]
MPEVTFYVLRQEEDAARIHALCRLVEKAWLQDLSVLILAEDILEAHRIDEALWSFRPDSFVPHCLVDNLPTKIPPALISWLGQDCPDAQVWFNMAHSPCQPGRRCQRLIQFVAGSAEQREIQRQQWRHYRDLGWSVNKIELA